MGNNRNLVIDRRAEHAELAADGARRAAPVETVGPARLARDIGDAAPAPERDQGVHRIGDAIRRRRGRRVLAAVILDRP